MHSIVPTTISSYPYLHPDTVARAKTHISSVLGFCSTCTSPNKPPSPLDILGVASLFGGDEAVSAMSTLHVYGNSRWWYGWYNSPGSYQTAKRLSLLGRSRSFDTHVPGVHIDLASLDKLECSMGPGFRAIHSGTIIKETSHTAALFVEECAAREGNNIEGRKSQTVGVTIAELNHVPEPRMFPEWINPHPPIFSCIPILVSIAACVACNVFGDLYSFSLILFGIFAHGLSCLALGSGQFVFTHPRPADKCPPGDGILGSGTEMVLLKGAEGAVNSITRGKFSFEFSSKDQYQRIEWCSFLLKIQSIAQLFLVPRASLFGQVMFVTSLGVSWIYNSWLSLGKTEVRRDILLNSVLQNTRLRRYILGTRTTAVVFIIFVLQLADSRKMLDELLPNDTPVWKEWKKKIVEFSETLKELEEEMRQKVEEEVRQKVEQAKLNVEEEKLEKVEEGRLAPTAEEKKPKMLKEMLKSLKEMLDNIQEEMLQKLKAKHGTNDLNLDGLEESKETLFKKLYDDVAAAFRAYDQYDPSN